MLAPPCASFSCATNRYPVRSSRFPRGFPWLTAENALSRIRVGNRCVDAAANYIRVCNLRNVPYCIENPTSSLMWKVPNLAKAILSGPHVVCKIHPCAFNTPYRKATTLVFGNIDAAHLGIFGLERKTRCHGRHGFCSFRPGHKHVVLMGPGTTKAAEYPPKLWHHLARTLLGN